MAVEQLKENIYWIGVKDPELRIFDIIMETKKGTTYNSYLINDEKVAILDIVKNGFYYEFKENIKNIIGDKKIDYVVVHHTELDHSGALIDLIKDYPEVKVVGSRATLKYLRDILNCEFNAKEANEEINLGNHTLSFISAPNLHWPDTMFTYVKEKNVLFTCDFTGSHFCPDESMTCELNNEYFAEMKYYYDCIMGPFPKYVKLGLEKIKDLKIDMIAPSHGPVHVREIEKILALYREWSKEVEVDPNKVEIFYISAYHNTEMMANFFKKKLEEKGFRADVTEITTIPLEESIEKISKAKGFLIGSPTINKDAVKPAWDLLSLVSAVTNRDKVAMAFGSYGWSGEGVPMLTDRLQSLKIKTAPGYKFCFVPSEEKYEEAEDYLDEFIELMR